MDVMGIGSIAEHMVIGAIAIPFVASVVLGIVASLFVMGAK